jgi:proteasome accessory factor A
MTAIFERLIGLETEYAIRFPSAGDDEPPRHQHLYEMLAANLQRRIPTAEVVGFMRKTGVFLATGGAVWFEHQDPTSSVGLIEGSTPECRSPRQLLACQRAQDRLLGETALEAAPSFTLLKNCRDSAGESYGAQENYSVQFATGWRLQVWRAGAVMLWLFNLLEWPIILLVFVVFMLAALPVSGLLYAVICAVTRPNAAQQARWHVRLFGQTIRKNGKEVEFMPYWIGRSLLLAAELIIAPAFIFVSWLLGVTDMRRTQRRMVAFVASRAVIGGSGWLAPDGRFHLTEKAQTRRALWTAIIPDHTRPVFCVQHYWKLANPFRPRFRELMAPRQRMELGLGDSNLCQHAEYLRVATTTLVLDAIEAGAISSPPMLRRPMHALRAISRDPTLRQAVAVEGGGKMTALEIQRWYLDACARFVASAPDAPQEARDVVRLWRDTLDKMEHDRSALVGRLDWVTKQFLLEQAGSGLPYAARKKIDLRYHELSTEGYFAQFQKTGSAPAIVSDEEIDQATRLPPVASPAWRRARYIREFSGAGLLRIDWRFLTVRGDGGKKQVIDLHESNA